jgi:7-cyano-7-deazaguanine synthase
MKNEPTLDRFRSESAVVLVSGGQDSTTALLWALETFGSVFGIGFFYRQKHAVELDAAELICRGLNIPFQRVDLSFMAALVDSNLFENTGDVNASHTQNPAVPSSFVPYRNLLFLTVAAGWASKVGARHLVTGVCETDFSGYADCRDVFIKSAQVALNLSTDLPGKDVVIHTPLMWMTKADEFAMAEQMGRLDFILENTMTCYNGDRTRHDYGMGCGQCPACHLRAQGWREFSDRSTNH